MRRVLLFTTAVLMSTTALAQDSTEHASGISWSVFADAYYSYDFSNPANHEKPSFLYNHNRHNEVNINLALLRAAYQHGRIRGKVGLMAGTYAQYNLSGEQELLRLVFEANAGVNLSRTGNVWIDAGVFPSHLGAESAISKENWTLTRTLSAEGSPYYESGAKITYTAASNKWLLSGLLLNGWQHIRRPYGNNTPAGGTQITYKPTGNTTINWSTFVGNDYADSSRKWRYFNNLYARLQPTDKLGILAGFDVGLEQQSKGSSTLNTWYTPYLIVRYTINEDWSIAARGEYYSDKAGVIVSTGTPHGFKVVGASLNIDRKIGDHFWWRTEARTFNSRDAIFTKNENRTQYNTNITTSFAVAF